MHNEHHSAGTKSFLGSTVPDYGDGDQSIDHALDILFNHDNVAPFIGKQLIQRMTTSNPSPAYIARVATAFNTGEFELPDGSTVGSGVRGDLAPVWAAILFDPVARSADRFNDLTWGKLREPFVRQVHWQRLADAEGHRHQIFNQIVDLGQVPYRPPSVFNFYRPGYVLPNSHMGNMGLALPEMQITTGPQIINIFHRMRQAAYGTRGDGQLFPTYVKDAPFIEDAQAYVDYLDLVYTANQLTDNTRLLLLDAIESITLPDNDPVARDSALWERSKRAHLLLMTSVEFMVQI